MSLRIVVFVDHEIGYRLLQKLIIHHRNTSIHLVAAVTTTENGKYWWPGVESLCIDNSITLKRYKEPLVFLQEFQDIDWYFLLSWKHILPDTLIKLPKIGVINLHYSLLPEYRGVYPVNWAIIDGRKKTGVTYHLVNKKVDGGTIISQKSLQIHLSDTARSLQLRLDYLAFDLFDEVLMKIKTQHWKNDFYIKRPDIFQGSYKSRKDFLSMNQLDLDRNYNVRDLLNLLRGKTFFPESQNLYIIDTDTGKPIYISINLYTNE